MPLEVVPVAFGPPAYAALARQVELAKAGDALRPVTVIVPSNYVGVATRRLLAGHGGLIGITFLTTYRLAELLGAASLAAEDRRPVSNPVLLVAVQEELHRDAGVFAAVAGHPATEEALVTAHKQLADLSPATLEKLATTSAQARSVVDLHRRVKQRLAAWYDEADLLVAASAELGRDHPVAAGLGHVVVFLPQELSQRAAGLLAALARDAPVTVLAGLTGQEDADAGVLRSLAWLGWPGPLAAPDAPAASTPGVSVPLRVVSASDADEEARAAVQVVVEAARAGTPLERIAVVHPGGEHAAALVHHHLGAAELPWNGASPDRLSGSVVGRTLLHLLALAGGAAPLRHDVFAVLAGAPVRRPGGGLVPSVAWERRSREAGLVGTSRDEWQARLAELAAAKEEAAEARRAEDMEAAARRLRREAEQALELRDFVVGLLDRLDGIAALTRWEDLAEAISRLVDDYLGGERVRAAWPATERELAEQVEAAVERLGRLDAVAPGATLERFARSLALELDAGLGRRGRFGDGVLVGPLAMALGLDLDVVVVIGLAEGLLPTRPREDPLLPDRDRQAVAPELPVAADRQGREHRQFLAAVAAAPTVVLTYPRGDLHRTTEHVASRWLLELVGARYGKRWWSAELLAADEPWLTHEASFAAAVRAEHAGARAPATEQMARLARVAAGGGLPGDTAYERAQRLLAARSSPAFGPYDGNLGGAEVRSPAAEGQLVSPTRLETWANCPYAYFVRYLLGVEAVENPEAVTSISRLEQGSLVHAVLERYVAERLEQGTAGGPEDLDALRRHIELAFGQAERRGVTGRPLLWRLQRADLQDHLEAFAQADACRCASDALEPVAAELRFGFDDGATEVQVSPDRTLRFRGSIDRVDRCATDGHLVVTDYKYSSNRKYKEVAAANPTASGTLLQLPAYALTARARLDEGRLPLSVTARYAFVRPDGDKPPPPVTLDVDDAVLDAWVGALAVIVDGIEQGHFPARPGEDLSRFTGYVSCPACDPDDLGTSELRRRWEQLMAAPELAAYVRLLGLEDVEAASEDDGEEAAGAAGGSDG